MSAHPAMFTTLRLQCTNINMRAFFHHLIFPFQISIRNRGTKVCAREKWRETESKQNKSYMWAEVLVLRIWRLKGRAHKHWTREMQRAECHWDVCWAVEFETCSAWVRVRALARCCHWISSLLFLCSNGNVAARTIINRFYLFIWFLLWSFECEQQRTASTGNHGIASRRAIVEKIICAVASAVHCRCRPRIISFSVLIILTAGVISTCSGKSTAKPKTKSIWNCSQGCQFANDENNCIVS